MAGHCPWCHIKSGGGEEVSCKGGQERCLREMDVSRGYSGYWVGGAYLDFDEFIVEGPDLICYGAQ